MRKSILWTIVVLSALAIFFMSVASRYSKPDPGSFLRSYDDCFVEVHMDRTDVPFAWIAEFERVNGDVGLAQLMEDYAPLLGNGALRLSLSSGDIGGGECFQGAVEMTEPRGIDQFVASLRSRALERGISVSPLDVVLPEHMTPLFSMDYRGRSVSLALWRGRAGTFMLFSGDPAGLAYMTPKKRNDFDRKTRGKDWVRAEVPLKCLFRSSKAASDDVLAAEWGLSVERDRSVLSCWSDWADVLLSPGRREELSAMGPVPLHGEGTMVGLLSWTGSFEDVLSNTGGEISKELGPLWSIPSASGVGEGDISEILDGRTSLFLGAQAGGILGNFPGFYILFEGVSADLGKRLTDLVASLPLPFGSSAVDLPGWDGGLAFKIPVTAVMAYGREGLIVGLMNPDGLAEKPEVPEFLAEAAGESSPSIVAVDLHGVSEMLSVYEGLFRLAGIGFSGEIEDLRFLLEPWDRLLMKPDGLDRATFFLFRRSDR